MTETSVAATFTIDGRPVTVHALHGGTVTVKRCHACGCLPERSPSLLRFLAILADRRFAAPMPIWTYAIDHPDGVYVIDAGASPSYNDPQSWRTDPRTRAVIQSFIKLDVREGETLPDRLIDAGLDARQVRAMVLTHQHVDHTGTVPAFAGVDIWTTRAEDAAAGRIGALHWRWRDSTTRIRYVDDEGVPDELGRTMSLTAMSLTAKSLTAKSLTVDGTIQAVCTPGHTPGSVSVRLRTDQTDIWFTGDIAFTAEGMNPSAPTAGIHTDMRSVRALQARLQHAGLLLPSHDPDVPKLLRAASST